MAHLDPGKVLGEHTIHRSVHPDPAICKPDRPCTQPLYGFHVVGYEDYGPVAALSDVPDPAVALLLESGVAYGENLVDQ